MSSLEKAIDCAIREAQIKIKQGKLIKHCDSEKLNDISNDGDYETLYSISSIYSQFVEDFDIDIAENYMLIALGDEFPEYL